MNVKRRVSWLEKEGQKKRNLKALNTVKKITIIFLITDA